MTRQTALMTASHAITRHARRRRGHTGEYAVAQAAAMQELSRLRTHALRRIAQRHQHVTDPRRDRRAESTVSTAPWGPARRRWRK